MDFFFSPLTQFNFSFPPFSPEHYHEYMHLILSHVCMNFPCTQFSFSFPPFPSTPSSVIIYFSFAHLDIPPSRSSTHGLFYIPWLHRSSVLYLYCILLYSTFAVSNLYLNQEHPHYFRYISLVIYGFALYFLQILSFPHPFPSLLFPSFLFST